VRQLRVFKYSGYLAYHGTILLPEDGRDKKYTDNDFSKKLKVLEHLADFGVDGRITLKLILRNRV
jgi:hypothetical protein